MSKKLNELIELNQELGLYELQKDDFIVDKCDKQELQNEDKQNE